MLRSNLMRFFLIVIMSLIHSSNGSGTHDASSSYSTTSSNIRNQQQQQQQQRSIPLPPPLDKNVDEGNGSSKSSNSFLRQSDYPFLSSNERNQWTSLSQTVEFLPAHTIDTSQWMGTPPERTNGNKKNHGTTTTTASTSNTQFVPPPNGRILGEEEYDQLFGSTTSSSNSVYGTQPFIAGSGEYDSYQQAWRLLGFMIDCGNGNSGYYSNNNNNQNNHNSRDNNYLTGEGCQRYVIWAAYVDLDYQGGGLGEYQFWDRESNSWNEKTCLYGSKDNNNNNNKNNNNNNNNNQQDEKRCAKMDCHLPDTHWKILGFFKHPSYYDWFGQLFKHEGVCIWDDDEYSFMKNAYKTWPNGCTISSATVNDEPIYYDLKPTSNGGITIGLYTDTRCLTEYQSSGSNDPVSVENILGNVLASKQNSHDNKNNNNNNNNNYGTSTFADSLELWDESFDAFKICQPCVAYDVNNVGYGYDDDGMHGSTYGSYRYGYDDDYKWYYYSYYYNKYKGNDFDCYDDADYTNVNQCMKFMAKTTMYTATFKDLSLANSQGTLVQNPLSGYRDGSISYLSTYNARTSVLKEYGFLFFSCALLLYGLYKYGRAHWEVRQLQHQQQLKPTPTVSLKEPLVFA